MKKDTRTYDIAADNPNNNLEDVQCYLDNVCELAISNSSSAQRLFHLMLSASCWACLWTNDYYGEKYLLVYIDKEQT